MSQLRQTHPCRIVSAATQLDNDRARLRLLKSIYDIIFLRSCRGGILGDCVVTARKRQEGLAWLIHSKRTGITE